MCASRASRLSDVADRLAQARSLLVITHARADGDALGSMLALARGARQSGRSAMMLVPDGVPPRYTYLFADETPARAEAFDDLAHRADTVVVVDTHAVAQLDRVGEKLGRTPGRNVVIDHHPTGEKLADVCWIDPSAAAAGVQVTELLEALDWPIDEVSANALGLAILTDTGWLRFSSTDGRALRMVADLRDRGLDTEALYDRVYQSDRLERLALMREVLGSLKLHCDGRLAMMTVRQADFRKTGARPDETENLVNQGLRVESVEVAAMLTENSDGLIRVSLRSKGRVDVSKVAGQFGGGGHARSAGLRYEGSIADLSAKLVTVVEAALS